MEEKIKPGKSFYMLALIIFIAGTSLFVLLLIRGINSMVKSSEQVVVPGKANIELSKSGHYTIFLETNSVIDGKLYRADKRDISGLSCTLLGKDNSESVKITAARGNSNYHIGDREGISIMEFNIDKPGTYEFTALYEGGTGSSAVLSITPYSTGAFVLSIFLSIGVFFVTIGLSIIIFAVTYSRRARAKREMAR